MPDARVDLGTACKRTLQTSGLPHVYMQARVFYSTACVFACVRVCLCVIDQHEEPNVRNRKTTWRLKEKKKFKCVSCGGAQFFISNTRDSMIILVKYF